HVPGLPIDIDEIHAGAAIETAIGRGDETVRNGPQPVTRAEAQCCARDMQGRRATVHSNGVLGTRDCDQRVLKPGDQWTLRQEVRLQDSNHRIDILRLDILPAVGDERLRHNLPRYSRFSATQARKASVDIHWVLESEA